jgi:D-aspartate ligase
MLYSGSPEGAPPQVAASAKRESANHTLVRVIVLGGSQNALSVARNLARHGIEVFAINFPYEAIRFSRYARYIHVGGDRTPAAWERFLLGGDSDQLRGSLLLPCSDEAISIVVNNYTVLSHKFLLEETDPAIRRGLLDKFVTYQLAKEADIPTVGSWAVHSSEDLERTMPELSFPLILKPLYSPHRHLLKFTKAVILPDQAALVEHFGVATRLGVGVLLMEYIPGGDDKLCSYYTYLDEDGNPLVHLTKRVKRRFPLESGDGTYHVTTWIPEAAELGLRFFRHLKFRGLGNIEFKWDTRDGKLKIIEANARFTASDCLIAKSGVNLALVTYNRVIGRPQPPIMDFEKSLVLCRPIEDSMAAWQLHTRGELRFSEWIADLRQTNIFPFFEWRDPVPAVAILGRRVQRIGAQLLPRFSMARATRSFGLER